MNRNRYTQTSRAWVILLSLMYAVSLVVGAVGLGMATTFGKPTRVVSVMTKDPAFSSLQSRFNSFVIKTAADEGIKLPDRQYIPTETLRRGVETGILISANFNEMPESKAGISKEFVTKKSGDVVQLTVEPLVSSIKKRVSEVPAIQKSANRRQTLLNALDVAFATKLQRDVIQNGWGIAYPMLVLIAQTAAIVGFILALIQLFFMAKSAHSLRRFLKVFGRVTYIVGFLGGLSAMVMESRTASGLLAIGGLDVDSSKALLQAFAPSWERLAAIVVIVGLLATFAAWLLTRFSTREEDALDEEKKAID